MKLALFYALLPVAVYIVAAELLSLWYETDLASDKPGFGVLLGGGLSGLLSLPGASLLESMGFPIAGSTERGARISETQMCIAATAAIIYVIALAPLTLISLGSRKSGRA